MQHAYVMDCDAACFDHYGYGTFVAKGGVGYGAAEMAVEVMVVHWPFVRAGNDEQGAIFFCHVVEHYAHSEQIVVAMRIKCPVLMPLNRAAVAGLFHVELVAIAPQAISDQLRYDAQNFLVMQGLAIYFMEQDRTFQASQFWVFGRVPGFEVEYFGVFGDLPRFFHIFIGYPTQVIDLVFTEHVLHTEISVFVIKRNLFLGEHGLLLTFMDGGICFQIFCAVRPRLLHGRFLQGDRNSLRKLPRCALVHLLA